MLQLLNYKKIYGTVPVLQVPEFNLEAGVYWLQGANGSGKTTLLKSIAGLIPFEGSISVAGVSLRKQRRLYTQKVSFAEAEPVFPLFLTGQELIAFYQNTKGGTHYEVGKIAGALGIAPFLRNQVGSYSSGMMKKLSLLLSLMGKPSLVLLDEPFITLDVKSVSELQSLIENSASEGTSFLISSHQELGVSLPFFTLQIDQQTLKHHRHVAGA
jgi:ABC-2 type transport system ATP-binding protein